MVKVCGAVTETDLAAATAAGADLVGLWHGIPGGHAELSAARLARLAAWSRTAGRPEPVLVTFAGDARQLSRTLASTPIRWVQLHGYQPPAMIRALKAAAELTVVKVLHVRGRECAERPLIGSYERAGADAFLLDAALASGRIGSTGQRLAPAAVTGLADCLSRPFFLAGGITARAAGEYLPVIRHPRFAGIDVDTAARGRGGCLQAGKIAGIRQSWAAACSGSMAADA